MEQQIAIDPYEEWVRLYNPLPNVFATARGEEDSIQFETYGTELEQIRLVNRERPDLIWTRMEADGREYISAGYHYVNRIGYHITQLPFDLKNPPDDIPVLTDAEHAELSND